MTAQPAIDPMGAPDPVAAPRCTATNRAGERCKRRPIPGGNVCTNHGGKAPQVKRRAQLRLLELIDPAIATLAREMATATKSSDRQRAANSLLDRAGMGRHQEVDIHTAQDLLIQRVLELKASRAAETDDDAPLQIVAGTVEESSTDEH